MEQLIGSIISTLLNEPRNLALVISLLANVALCWTHVIWRREERADRDKTIETFAKITEVLNNLRNAFSAKTGKEV